MKSIRERDELKDDSAEFLMSISEPGLQHWHGQTRQHCPCLMLHSAHISNSVKGADVSARTQLVTATVTQSSCSMLPYPRVQLFSVTRFPPQGSCPGGTKHLLRNFPDNESLFTTPADFHHQQPANVDFRLLQVAPRDSSALSSLDSIPQWVVRMKESITG